MATDTTCLLNGESPWAGYGEYAARPLISLLFISPLLVAYELGVLALGPQALRNGADLWLRFLLERIGFGQYFLLPLLTCGLLLAWHHLQHHRWSIRWPVLAGMLLESVAFAFMLLMVARWQQHFFHDLVRMEIVAQSSAVSGRLIGYCGAGIYEELLFRLMLLPAIAYAIRATGVTRGKSLLAAVLLSSLIFSAAHYRLFFAYGYAFDWYSFVFRCLAGLFFATLFICRGFGITAASHALYDMLVEVA